MVKEKKSVHRIQMTEGKHQIIKQLLQEYNIETVADIQAALRDLLGSTIKLKWSSILGTRNPNVQTVMIIVTVIKRKPSIPAWAVWNLMYLRTGNQLFNRRLSRKDRNTYLK